MAGGTWLACTREGRVSFLTNVLELHTLPEAKSRGDLPLRFLEVCFLIHFLLSQCVYIYLIIALKVKLINIKGLKM